MGVAEKFGDKIPTIGNLKIAITVLYEARTADEETQREVIELAESGHRVTRATVKALKGDEPSARSVARSARTGPLFSSISVEKFCIDALSVAKRLVARLENPSDDMVEGVKNCLAEIEALIERCQGNGGAA
jgi:hypothetical protein